MDEAGGDDADVGYEYEEEEEEDGADDEIVDPNAPKAGGFWTGPGLPPMTPCFCQVASSDTHRNPGGPARPVLFETNENSTGKTLWEMFILE